MARNPWQTQSDLRLRDVELILRFFALYDDLKSYERPMKDFLSSYMRRVAHAGPDTLSLHRTLFHKTVAAVRLALGPKPFHVFSNQLNVAVFDSVFVAFASYTEPFRPTLKGDSENSRRMPSTSNTSPLPPRMSMRSATESAARKRFYLDNDQWTSSELKVHWERAQSIWMR